MSKLEDNKYVQIASYALAVFASIFVTYYGLTMSDPQTGNLMGVTFSPKDVTLAGLGCGTVWVLWIALSGFNFKNFEMPRIAIVTWCIFYFGGALAVSPLRELNDGRYSTGSVIFMMSALLPLLLYVAIGVAVSRLRH